MCLRAYPSMSFIFKYWTRGTDPLLLIGGNESTTPRQARLMGKHVNEEHFSYFAPPSKGLIEEGASLRLITHPNMNLRGAPPSHRVWEERLAQGETWLMQGHPGAHRLNKLWTSTPPMSGLCFISSYISSLKGMTKECKTKNLHCPGQPI